MGQGDALSSNAIGRAPYGKPANQQIKQSAKNLENKYGALVKYVRWVISVGAIKLRKF